MRMSSQCPRRRRCWRKLASSAKSVGEPRGFGERAERVIEGDPRVVVVAEAVRLSGRNSGLVVEALDGALGEPAAGGEPVEEEAAVSAQSARELLERFEAGAHGEGGPLHEEAIGPDRRAVAPEAVELLLEQAGADGAEVDREELSQPTALAGVEVL